MVRDVEVEKKIKTALKSLSKFIKAGKGGEMAEKIGFLGG